MPVAGAEGTARRTATGWLCLLFGAYFLIRGLVGVALDFDLGTPGEGWHGLFHISAGMGLLVASRWRTVTTPAAIAFGVGYLALAALGVADGTDAFGLVPLQTEDNLTHAAFGTVALAVGVVTAWRSRPPAPTRTHDGAEPG